MAERFIVGKCNHIVGYDLYKSMADVTSVVAQVELSQELLMDETVEYKSYKIGQHCVLVITESKSTASYAAITQNSEAPPLPPILQPPLQPPSLSYSFVDIRTGDSLAWEVVNDSDGAIYFTRTICNNSVRLETEIVNGSQYVSMEYCHGNISNIYIHGYRAKSASAIMIDKYVGLVPTIPPELCDPSCISAVIDDMFNAVDVEYNFTFIIDESGLSGHIRLVQLFAAPDIPPIEHSIKVTLIGDSMNTILVMPIQVDAMRTACILRPLILAAFNVSD